MGRGGEGRGGGAHKRAHLCGCLVRLFLLASQPCCQRLPPCGEHTHAIQQAARRACGALLRVRRCRRTRRAFLRRRVQHSWGRLHACMHDASVHDASMHDAGDGTCAFGSTDISYVTTLPLTHEYLIAEPCSAAPRARASERADEAAAVSEARLSLRVKRVSSPHANKAWSVRAHELSRWNVTEPVSTLNSPSNAPSRAACTPHFCMLRACVRPRRFTRTDASDCGPHDPLSTVHGCLSDATLGVGRQSRSSQRQHDGG